MRNLPRYTLVKEKNRVPEIDPRRRSVSVKTQKRCPRIRTEPYHTALTTQLQTERFSAKKRPSPPAPQKTAYLAHPARATRTFARRGTLRGNWSVRGSHDPRATHPQPAPGRGRRSDARSGRARQRRRRVDAHKERAGPDRRRRGALCGNRHRAAAVTGTTSRRWRGASEF